MASGCAGKGGKRMSQDLAWHASQATAIRRQTGGSAVAGVLLIGCLYSPGIFAGPTFPDPPGQTAGPQAEPPPQSDPAVPAPMNRNRADIEADIRSMELQRSELLARFVSAHPDVRALDRRLQIRRKQLEMLEPEPGAKR
jgi:hypothetical protein